MIASATAIAVNLDSRAGADLNGRMDANDLFLEKPRCGRDRGLASAHDREVDPARLAVDELRLLLVYVTRVTPGRVRAQITQIAIAIISSDQKG